MSTPFFMLDTNITSALIRGNSPALEAQLQALPLDRWCISAVTRSEQLFGLALKPQATRLARTVNAFLDLAPVAPWDRAAADAHARLRAVLQTTGRPIGVYDTMIAGHALALGAILVTRDSDFQRVPDLIHATSISFTRPG